MVWARSGSLSCSKGISIRWWWDACMLECSVLKSGSSGPPSRLKLWANRAKTASFLRGWPDKYDQKWGSSPLWQCRTFFKGVGGLPSTIFVQIDHSFVLLWFFSRKPTFWDSFQILSWRACCKNSWWSIGEMVSELLERLTSDKILAAESLFVLILGILELIWISRIEISLSTSSTHSSLSWGFWHQLNLKASQEESRLGSDSDKPAWPA